MRDEMWMVDGQRCSDHSENQSMRNGNDITTVSKNTTKNWQNNDNFERDEDVYNSNPIQPWNEVRMRYNFKLFGVVFAH
jgi:hypothetical protein